ncbi:MAG: tetratricopeptide repeat protein [Flavobacteriaceae bacterium]
MAQTKKVRRVIFIFSMLFSFIGMYAQAIEDSLLEVIKNTKDPRKKINLYLDLHYELNRNDPNKALQYAEMANEVALQKGEADLYANSNFRLAASKSKLGAYEAALNHLSIAENYYQEKGPLSWLISTYTEKASVYRSMLFYEEALNYNIKALELSPQVKDTSSMAKILNNLGALYKEKKQFKDSEKSYLEALKLVEAIQFNPAISAIANNLGLVYIEMEDFDAAENYFRKSLKIKSQINDKLGIARATDNLGILFQKKGDCSKALEFFEASNLQAVEVNNIELQIETSLNKASCLTQMGRHHESKVILTALASEYTKEMQLEMKISLYKDFASNLSAEGNYKEALFYNNQLLQLSDSLNDKKLSLARNELEARFKSEQKAKEIAELQTLSKEQELKLTKKTQERNLLIGVGFILLLAFALVYWMFRNKQKINQKLKELDLIKSNFFTTISHELRTPLTLIKGPLEELFVNKETYNREQLVQLDLIKKNTISLEGLVNQVFDLSKLESGSIKIHSETIANFGFVHSLVEGFSFLAKEKNISFHIAIGELANPIVLDVEITQKILGNLFSNAVKYCPENGSIKGTLEYTGGVLFFELTNTGNVLSSEDISKIFQRYYQLDDKRPGIGLGLYLVKQWVELLNGSISVESKKNKGTTFLCHFPCAEVDSEENKQPFSFSNEFQMGEEENEYSDLDSTNNPKDLPILLLIDDNKDMMLFLTEILSQSYHIIQSHDGLSGEEMAFRNIPDLIISDVMMPGKDGTALCKTLKSDIRTSHIPIVLLTAKSGAENELIGTKNGADDYILKPFNAALLKAKLENLLAIRKSIRESYEKELILKPFEVAMPSDEQQFVSKLREVFAIHLMDSDFTPDKFATAMHLSRMQLHRKIKALTGLSTSNFVKSERIKLAARLLEKPHDSIAGIGYQVGFNDHAYFSTTFKEFFQCSPSEYASKHL